MNFTPEAVNWGENKPPDFITWLPEFLTRYQDFQIKLFSEVLAQVFEFKQEKKILSKQAYFPSTVLFANANLSIEKLSFQNSEVVANRMISHGAVTATRPVSVARTVLNRQSCPVRLHLGSRRQNWKPDRSRRSINPNQQDPLIHEFKDTRVLNASGIYVIYVHGENKLIGCYVGKAGGTGKPTALHPKGKLGSSTLCTRTSFETALLQNDPIYEAQGSVLHHSQRLRRFVNNNRNFLEQNWEQRLRKIYVMVWLDSSNLSSSVLDQAEKECIVENVFYGTIRGKIFEKLRVNPEVDPWGKALVLNLNFKDFPTHGNFFNMLFFRPAFLSFPLLEGLHPVTLQSIDYLTVNFQTENQLDSAAIRYAWCFNKLPQDFIFFFYTDVNRQFR